MARLPLPLVLVLVLVLGGGRTAESFTAADVPVPRFSFDQGTIHVTIPGSRGMSLAAIHLTINDPVHGTQPGKINKDLGPSRGGDFSTSVNYPWQTGDVINYWVYVIVDGLGYHRLAQRYVIRATNAGPPPRGPFEVPSPRFHLSPHVITVTVPALPGITLAAIHLSLNVPVPGTQAGRYNQDLDKSGDVFTTMVIADWKKGDTIHYWVYVIYEGLGRHKLAQQYVIDTGSRPAEPVVPQPTSSTPFSSMLPQDCGTRFFDMFGLEGFSLRVAGANPVKSFNYPWQAQIQTTRGKHVCGGIIISDRHILTAAHCLDVHLTRHLQVVVGQNDLNEKEDEEQIFGIQKQFSHINFGGRVSGGRYINDIAILLLRETSQGGIKFGAEVQPACLPAADQPEEVTACLVSGWGQANSDDPLQKLHGTEIPYVSSSYCTSPEVWGDSFNGSAQLCAGDIASPEDTATGRLGRDACGGDSGGPLACLDSHGRWTVTGIVSWGDERCGETRRVGVYTRVSTYLDWIANVLENVLVNIQ